MRETGWLAFWLAAVLLLLASSNSGCGCSEIRDDVVELRKLHAAYRSATVPRADLEAEKVDALGDRLDAVMANLEKLTE